MKQSILWRRLALGGALIAGLALSTTATAATPPDAWVTTKVKLALMTTEGVSSTDVNVDTIDGRVTLHGTVATEAEKATATQAARAIEGVKEIRNMLAVVAPAKQDAVAASDEQIKANVERTLAQDKALADSDIDVTSVNKGVVVLSGSAATLSDHVRAVEDVRAVAGVRQVSSQVKSPATLSDAEIWRDSTTQAAKDAGASASGAVADAGGAVSDMWITTAAKVRLMANDQTPSTDINVDTRNGVVTLFGMVPTAAAKQAAAAEAGKVSGVTKVNNQLQVVAPAAQEAVKANDSEIKDQVAKKVDDDVIDDADISVEVKDGVVRLTGTVDSQTDRLRALTLARSTNGVRSVVDELQVEVN
ncbi:MAG: BON domain-containing protein [Candidatus Binatia bacterium]